MNIKYHFFLFLSIIITSCGPAEPKKKVDEGKVEANIYTSAELGWSIKIPNGWKITDLDETQKRSKKGLELIEKTFDTQVDSSGLKNLISFQKNNLNIFQSTTEPFVEEHEGEWEESNNSVKQLIYETYVNQGMNVDSSVTQAETIDGVKFNTFTYRIYAPNGDLILTQILYSTFRRGYDFGANLNYNNEKDGEELLKAFRNSKFMK